MKHIFKKLHHRSNQDSPSSPSSSASSASSAAPPSSLSPPTTTTSVTPSPATNRHQIDYYSSEEEYQVQLALALSVSGEDGVSDADRIRAGGGGGGSVGSAKERDDAADLLSRRYWDYSVLDFEEKVIDGFYDIYGLSTDTSSQGKMPSLAELETKPGTSNFEVIIVNRRIDHSLEELLQIAHCISLDCSYCEVNVLVQKLAELVTDHLGGPVKDANGILSKWVERSTDLRSSLHTTVLPIGSLKIGLSRHRALLFKVLADNVGLPCRLVKGSHYTGIEDDAVNIIKLENEIEFLVDLMGAPGALIPADILSTTDISSNPQLPPLTKFSNLQINDDSETYYPIPKPLSGKSGNISPSLSNKSGDNEVGSSKSSMFKGVTRMNVNVIPYTQSKKEDPQNLFSDLNPFQMKGTGKSTLQNNQVWNKGEVPWKNRNDLVTGKPPLGWKNRQAHNEVPRKKENDIFVEEFFSRTDSTTSSSASSSDNVSDVVNPDISKLQMSSNDKNPHKNLMGLHDRGKQTHARLGETNMRFGDQFSMNSLIGSRANEIDPIMDDVGECEIPWEDLVIGERIGLGSYGEVYRADWNGTEVAVKKFLDQDFSGDALDEFRREVRIMRRLRHENVVTYMGAVTRPPNLSIITEFLPRGSLYRIIHRPNCQIDEKRRIKMALDVARGMSCLHSSKPTIVHRDLKSPNLLVDNNWRVKVCDFGLSRLKHNTFLSSKSTAGTPEWMAPEVLRNEPSTEKCDIYSFGVILWELATLKMPWSDMNPMQVVGAVGFQNQRLDISKDVDPLVASIISHCWLTDPTKRPSFDDLALALGRLEHLVIPSIHDQQDLSLR